LIFENGFVHKIHMQEENQRNPEIEDITFGKQFFNVMHKHDRAIQFLDCCVEEAALKNKYKHLNSRIISSFTEIEKNRKREALEQVQMEFDYIQGKKAFLKKMLEN